MSKDLSLLRIDLGKNGGKKSFFTSDEIREWIAVENNFYSWLNSARSQHSNVAYIAEHIFNMLANLSNAFQNYINTTDVNQKEVFLTQLKHSIENCYVKKALIHSSTAAGSFINKLTLTDPLVAAHALGYLINVTGNSAYWNGFSVRGFNEAWGFLNGIRSNENEKVNLDHLKVEMQDLLDQSTVDRVRLGIDFEEIKTNIQNESIRHNQSHEELIKNHQEQLDKFVKESNTRLENIAQAYDKHMALQSSVEYWTSRASHHKTEGNKYLRLTGLAGALGLSFIVLISHTLLNIEGIKLTKDHPNLTFSDVPIWHITLVILATSIFIWATRILVRLLLSNLHLETDAGERVVMAKTYIAMLREGQAPKDDDRKLILASLFRPNVTGIINDDAMPFNLDIMQKIIGGKT